MDNAPLIGGIFALLMAVFVWWSGRRDKLDAAAALIAKEERDLAKEERARAYAKADRDELAATLKASQVTVTQQAVQTVAEELGTQGRRDAQVAREHQTELVTEQQRAAKVITDQLAAEALARQAADERAALQRQTDNAAAALARGQLAQTQTEMAETIEHDRRNRLASAATNAAAWRETAAKIDVNTEMTAAAATQLAENTDLTKVAGETAAAAYDKASERLAALDLLVSSLDQKVGVTNSRIELFAAARARSLATEAAAHLEDAQHITDELGDSKA